MEYQLPKAKCLICNSYYTPRGIGKHVRSCLDKRFQNVPHKDIAYYLVFVSPTYDKSYFLYLLLRHNTLLEELDDFLRSIWLECCGHMSAFFCGKYNDIPMDYCIEDLEHSPKKILYHYDFGSTTELQVKILERYDGPLELKEKIILLSRNSQPVVPCDVCGEREAVTICADCQWQGLGWMCEQCVKDHEHDEMLLPVCNSPRVGVCGYCGEYDDKSRTDKSLYNFLKQIEKVQI